MVVTLSYNGTHGKKKVYTCPLQMQFLKNIFNWSLVESVDMKLLDSENGLY
jgi:hypothetical protein